MTRYFRYFLFLPVTGLLFSLLSACVTNNIPAVFLTSLYGTWTITGYQEPGISAMNQQEINAWLGKNIQLNNHQATLPGESCQSPAYQIHSMSPQDFQSEFRFTPVVLGYTGGFIKKISITCKKDRFAPGGTLIWLNKEKLFMTWDGVFFQLQKI